MLTSPLFVTVQKGLATRRALRVEGRVRASGTYSTSRPSRQARPRPSAPAKSGEVSFMLTSPLFVTVQKGLAMRCALRAEGRVRASGTYSTSRPSRQARPRPSAPAKKSGTAKAIPDFFRKRANDLAMRCTPRSTRCVSWSECVPVSAEASVGLGRSLQRAKPFYPRSVPCPRDKSFKVFQLRCLLSVCTGTNGACTSDACSKYPVKASALRKKQPVSHFVLSRFGGGLLSAAIGHSLLPVSAESGRNPAESAFELRNWEGVMPVLLLNTFRK